MTSGETFALGDVSATIQGALDAGYWDQVGGVEAAIGTVGASPTSTDLTPTNLPIIVPSGNTSFPDPYPNAPSNPSFTVDFAPVVLTAGAAGSASFSVGTLSMPLEANYIWAGAPGADFEVSCAQPAASSTSRSTCQGRSARCRRPRIRA